MRAISNSSVLIALSSIGQLPLLTQRFPEGILPILGTLGLLIWAKQQGVINSLQEQLDALQAVAKFRLSQQVYNEALRRVGELP